MDNKRLYEVFSNYVLDMMNSDDDYVSFLREYAKTNESEFFAVAVECFFERPQLMKDHEPKLFFSFCKLLNQNPLNTSHNYRLDTTENPELKTNIFNQNYFKISAILLVLVGFFCLNTSNPIFQYFTLNLLFQKSFLFIAAIYFGSIYLKINTKKLITIVGLIVLGILPILFYISSYF